MAYNYEYPYTDPNRYNSDWILNRVKEVSLEWIETRKEWNNTREEFASLKAFIQNYFAQLDLQDEVNVKLDIMARDGSLSALISPLFSEYKKEIDRSMSEQNDKINVLNSRMDTFTSLPDGSTAGDAELQDIRIGYNGKVYHSAGDAVRMQVSDLKEGLSQLSGDITDLNEISFITVYDKNSDITLKNKYFLRNNGVPLDSNNYDSIAFIPVECGDVVEITGVSGDNTDIATVNLYGIKDVTGYLKNEIKADGTKYVKHIINITDNEVRYISTTFRIDSDFPYSVKVFHNGVKSKNKIYTKEYRNQLYIDECRINDDGSLLYTVKDKVEIMKTIEYARMTGVTNFCVMVEMCMYNGSYKRSLTDQLLSELMDYAESIGCCIDFVKIHENTPIGVIASDYEKWKSCYESVLHSLLLVCENHTVEHFTVLNEKGDFYNSDVYVNDVVNWINLVKNKGYKSGVTTNVVVREEILNISNFNYVNVYPSISYNQNLNPKDVYDVMYFELMSVLSHHRGKVYISEIGSMYYTELMSNPASWKIKSFYTKNVEQYKNFFANVYDAIQNIDGYVGFNDFYAHSTLTSEYLASIRKTWLKGE